MSDEIRLPVAIVEAPKDYAVKKRELKRGLGPIVEETVHSMYCADVTYSESAYEAALDFVEQDIAKALLVPPEGLTEQERQEYRKQTLTMLGHFEAFSAARRNGVLNSPDKIKAFMLLVSLIEKAGVSAKEFFSLSVAPPDHAIEGCPRLRAAEDAARVSQNH